MIQQRSILKIVDNSGAKNARCIKIIGGFKKKTAGIGEIIVVSIQQLRDKTKQNSKVLKGSVFKALIIKTAKTYRKKDGSFFRMAYNSAVLINNQGNPVGTRIFSSFPKVIKKKKFLKFSSICTGSI